jgi:Rrf2 family nitric oxide-sensitive transcriptional repressor
MRLTTFSDYCLRTLMYLGLRRDRLATIPEIAGAYGISANHLTKVVQRLVALGHVESVRGKGGGLRLARPPAAISVGALVRATEESLALAECFDPARSTCPIAPDCVLQRALGRGLDAFLAVLDEYTLADLLRPRTGLSRALAAADAPVPRAARPARR